MAARQVSQCTENRAVTFDWALPCLSGIEARHEITYSMWQIRSELRWRTQMPVSVEKAGYLQRQMSGLHTFLFAA
jgi:hypothetical protein